MDALVKLIIVDGEPGEVDREIALRGSEFVIGRAASCDLSIDHSRVSMQHCRLVLNDDKLSVQDLHSTYGTAVNGVNTPSSTLEDGDLLKVGPWTFLVAIGAEPSKARRDTHAAMSALRGRGVLTTAGDSRGRDPNDDTPVVESARRIFESLTSRGREESASRPTAEPESPLGNLLGRRKSFLNVREVEDGIAVVELLDRAIIQESDIYQINTELDELIAKGTNRIVLDFGQVRHLSSQALGILLSAQKKCKSAGGVLKVCNPRSEVGEVFKIANLRRAVEIYENETSALESDWPDPPEEAPAPAAAPASRAATVEARPAAAPAFKPVARPAPVVKLVIQVGKSKGKSITIHGPRFLVGRDDRCQLRPASEAISRVHTRIDQREGRVFVRDMGTTNGTLLGDQILHGAEAEAFDGDRLQIGPLEFQFVITSPQSERASSLEDTAASWLFEGVAAVPGDTAMMPMPNVKAAAEARKKALDSIQRLRVQPAGDTLIVTILSAELVDEEQIGPVRHELLSLLDQPVPKRLILRMEHVTALSSLAVAMLMSHYQRLDRMGGGIRLCSVRNDLLPGLESILMSGQITMFPTMEAALNEPWPIS